MSQKKKPRSHKSTAEWIERLPPHLKYLLADFPSDVDPLRHFYEDHVRELEKIANLSTFNTLWSEETFVPIPHPSDPQLTIGFQMVQNPHRFKLGTRRQGNELEPLDTIDGTIGKLQLRLMFAPDDYVAFPDQDPPPTALDPTRSQRFVVLDGRFQFDDPDHSAIEGFGTGRTFPGIEDGQPWLRVAAVENLLRGFGKFAGHRATVAMTGRLVPPKLFVNLVIRIIDENGNLISLGHLRPPNPIPNPDPGSRYFIFMGEQDPDEPSVPILGADGFEGVQVREVLREITVDFEIDGRRGLVTHTKVGPVVGKLRTTLRVDPFVAPDEFPVPVQTEGTLLSFCDRRGNVKSTLQADVVEGRGFGTPLGRATPIFRFGGFGPIRSGTGEFADLTGMMTVNAAVSVFPSAISNIYTIRVAERGDPPGAARESS